MNRSNLQHGVIAIVLFGLGAITGDLVLATAIPIALFVGREHAHAERRMKDQGYWEDWRDGWRFWMWTQDNQLDLAIPVAAVLICLAAVLVAQRML